MALRWLGPLTLILTAVLIVGFSVITLLFVLKFRELGLSTVTLPDSIELRRVKFLRPSHKGQTGTLLSLVKTKF